MSIPPEERQKAEFVSRIKAVCLEYMMLVSVEHENKEALANSWDEGEDETAFTVIKVKDVQTIEDMAQQLLLQEMIWE
jgi:hypothetical protein